MRLVRRTVAVCLAVLFMAPAAHAQSNVIDRSALDKAVQERVARDQADLERAAVQVKAQMVRFFRVFKQEVEALGRRTLGRRTLRM